MIDWSKGTKEDVLKTVAIIKRASRLLKGVDTMSMQMSLQACHTHGCEIKLDELLQADDGNLLHDVCGIDNNINKETGELENCFVPRYAA